VAIDVSHVYWTTSETVRRLQDLSRASYMHPAVDHAQSHWAVKCLRYLLCLTMRTPRIDPAFCLSSHNTSAT